MTHRSLRFDPQDYQLLTMINRTVTKSRKSLPGLLPQLSPSGIMELAVPAELRMASAVLRLLDTLSQGHADERLEALAALRDEVLVMARTSLRTRLSVTAETSRKEAMNRKGTSSSSSGYRLTNHLYFSAASILARICLTSAWRFMD